MSKRPPIPAASRHAPGLIPVMALLGLCFSGQASADTTEHARLAAALRHLDAIERLVAEQPGDEHARYHFDYARLNADLGRVRAGIHDYLTPSRAQPRDPSLLLGDYRQSVARPPEPQATP